MLNDEDRILLYEATVAIRESRAALAEQTRTTAKAARLGRQSAFAHSVSRVLLAVIVASALLGAANTIQRQPKAPAVVTTNVATHDDVSTVERCVRSDIAVIYIGAQPDPLCGPPPGNPTPGTVKP